jgi:hypothetical protein
MADSGMKCIMFFHLNKAGWSEFHYHTSTDFNVVKNAFVQLFKLRMALSVDPVEAFRGRMSLLGSPRSSILLDNSSMLQIQQALGSPIVAGDKSDQPKAAAMARFYADSVSKRNNYIGGIPDGLITEDPEGIPAHVNPIWQGRFDSYKTQLTSGVWGFRGQIPAGTGAATQVSALSTLQRDSDGLFGFTVATGTFVVAEGAKVQLRNFKMDMSGQASPNGTWEVDTFVPSSPGPTKDSIYLRRSDFVDASSVRLLGKANRLLYNVYPYTSGTVVSQTTHKRGKSFLFGRGRVSRSVAGGR